MTRGPAPGRKPSLLSSCPVLYDWWCRMARNAAHQDKTGFLRSTTISGFYKLFSSEVITRIILHSSEAVRVGPIYRLAAIYGRYRYRYIGIGNLDIGIGHIGIGIGIGYSGYRLYRYRPNIGKNTWISVKISAYIGQNTRYRSNIGQNENIGIGIGGRYVGANISVSVSAKISAGRIYLYRYRLDPYRSNPTGNHIWWPLKPQLWEGRLVQIKKKVSKPWDFSDLDHVIISLKNN